MTTYVYNEHDENQVLTMRNKLKKKKRKRRINFVLIVLLLIFLVIFFFGDMSKVKKITVSGCHLTSAEEIIERLPVKSKKTYFFKVNKKQVETEVEKMIFVEKATVTKDLIGNIKKRNYMAILIIFYMLQIKMAFLNKINNKNGFLMYNVVHK